MMQKKGRCICLGRNFNYTTKTWKKGDARSTYHKRTGYCYYRERKK